ncbi:MAG: calcium/sodium antiporter [Pseudomonadota bacterium]
MGLARTLGVSELVIGAVFVGFGTSMPELVTSIEAIQGEAVGIAVGNVVGSNIANVMLVLGVAALIRPILTNPSALARDTVWMIAATVLFCALIWFDVFTRPVGLALVGLLAIYVISSIVLDRRGSSKVGEMHAEEAEIIEAHDPWFIALPLAIVGIAGVVFGAHFLIEGGVDLAATFGVSEAVIGLTVVAIGTSLPELATSVISALKGKSDVALGNILGSNLFNILCVMGLTATVHPFSVLEPTSAAQGYGYGAGDPSIQPDTLVPLISWEHIGALILSVFLLLLFAFTGRRLARWEGFLLLAGYALYMGMIFDLVPTLA